MRMWPNAFCPMARNIAECRRNLLRRQPCLSGGMRIWTSGDYAMGKHIFDYSSNEVSTKTTLYACHTKMAMLLFKDGLTNFFFGFDGVVPPILKSQQV